MTSSQTQTDQQLSTPTRPTLVELKNVSVSFGRISVLKNVSLRVSQGVVHGIIGPSGTGKTTLIKIINGLVRPDEGYVNVLGCRINGQKHADLISLRHQIGYIPQNLGLVKILTARENVLMGSLARIGSLRTCLKIFPKIELERSDILLEKLGLLPKADIRVHKLSGGEQKRVAIARALMQNPKILLADEFLSDLDYNNAERIMKEIIKLKINLDLTVIMVEHNLALAREFCNTVSAITPEGSLEVSDFKAWEPKFSDIWTF
ncbi:ATP-binding cassette domain-containing protein [PVC group bacterium]|nr:ATP-binding cassette domain-containing protein [PVC group bacterium]